MYNVRWTNILDFSRKIEIWKSTLHFYHFRITFEHFRIIEREVFRVFVRKNICPHSFQGWSMLLNQIFVRLERLTIYDKTPLIPKVAWSISKKVKSIVLVGPTLVRNLRGEFELFTFQKKFCSLVLCHVALAWQKKTRFTLSYTYVFMTQKCVSFHEFRYVVGNISTDLSSRESLVAHFLLMLL